MRKLFSYIYLIFLFNISCENKKILLILGTRPEAIKMIPVYYQLKKNGFQTLLCSTGQHIEMVNEILDFFKIKADFELNIMKPNQDLFYITNQVLTKIKDVLDLCKPDLVLVQGDTTTAMSAALAAFYLKIPIGHIEAGLRTNNIFSPFPEEANRKIISLITDFHFTPTKLATQQLLKENINPEKIFNTGNTVVDALYNVQKKIENNEVNIDLEIKNIVNNSKRNQKKVILLTIHRRESLMYLENSLNAIKEIAQINDDLEIIYPVHPNPLIRNVIDKIELYKLKNIHITKPLSYKDLIYSLINSFAVITDSGGIQEEAISLAKPTLVLRLETERMEGINAGAASLIKNFETENIKKQILDLLQYKRSLKNLNVYGDGTASKQIVDIIKKNLT